MRPHPAVAAVVGAVKARALEAGAGGRQDAPGLGTADRTGRPVGGIGLDSLEETIAVLTAKFI